MSDGIFYFGRVKQPPGKISLAVGRHEQRLGICARFREQPAFGPAGGSPLTDLSPAAPGLSPPVVGRFHAVDAGERVG